jgi:hypothetical protein
MTGTRVEGKFGAVHMRSAGVGGIKLWVDGHGADEEVIELVPERRKRIEVRNQDAVFGTHR